MNAPTADASRLVLRPTTGSRVIGWAFTAFGLLFAYAGFSAGNELGGVISMAAFGTFTAVFGVSLASARVVADSRGLRYRNFISRRVPNDQIVAVGIGPGSGGGYPRVAIIVQRRDRRALRLTALQGADTGRTWWRLEDHVAALSEVLNVPRFDEEG